MSYTTKLTVEVEVVTHFGPQDAINLTKLVLSAPAFTSVTIVSASTDYQSNSPSDRNVRALATIPLKVR